MRPKKYWSIQTKEAWEVAVERGYLEGSYEHVGDDDYRKPYEWMMRQMSFRLEHYQREIPIWLWTEKPDLRKPGHSRRGDEMVRLTISLLPDRVLLSDFEAWHMVLNNTYCTLNEAEYNNLENAVLTKEQSWERIFKLNLPREIDWIGEVHLQGTTGRIKMENILKVEHFTAR